MVENNFLNKLDTIDDLPTLPSIAIEVNKMLKDYDTSIKKLSGIIDKDQAMASKILKLVNSAFFGLRSEVSNIPHAVVLLGFNTVRNAVVSVSVIDAFSRVGALEGFDIRDFWKHSVAVAVTCGYIAEKSRLHSPDDSFIGGLLHDIGKVILSQHFQDLFQKIWIATQEKNLSFYDAEKKESPVDHAQIGGYMAKKWQLPIGLVETIHYHHTVRKDAADPNLLMIVHVADIIINRYKSGVKGKISFSAFAPDALKAMGTLLNNVHEWYPEVSNEIDSACEFFLKG